MKIVIIGGGYVGQALKAQWDRVAEVILVNEFVESFQHARGLLTELRPDVVVNTAILGTPASIQKLEEGSKEWNDHILVNVLLPEWLGLLATELKFHFVHISTLMFLQDWHGETHHGLDDESRGYDEIQNSYQSSPLLSHYGRMKLLAEHRLRGGMMDIPAYQYNCLIARIHLPFSALVHDRNILQRLTSFDKLATDETSMTDLDELATVLLRLIETKANGVFHLVNSGVISFYRIGELLQEAGLRNQALAFTTLADLNAARGDGPYQPHVVAYSSRLPLIGLPPMDPVELAVQRAIDSLKRSMDT